MTTNGRLERETLGTEEARDQLLFPEQTVAAPDPAAHRRAEERRRRRGDRNSTQATGSPTVALRVGRTREPGSEAAIERRAPPTEGGRHQEQRSTRECADAKCPHWKRFFPRPHRGRERIDQMAGHVPAPRHITDATQRIEIDLQGARSGQQEPVRLAWPPGIRVRTESGKRAQHTEERQV